MDIMRNRAEFQSSFKRALRLSVQGVSVRAL